LGAGGAPHAAKIHARTHTLAHTLAHGTPPPAGVMESGHLKEWADYSAARLAQDTAPTTEGAAVLVAAQATLFDTIAEAGFNATTDFPTTCLYASRLHLLRSAVRVWHSRR
jgi:hypothetical protein